MTMLTSMSRQRRSSRQRTPLRVRRLRPAQRLRRRERCWTVRRPGAAGPSSPSEIGPGHRQNLATVPAQSTDLERAIEAYMTFLAVERGLAAATIRAYRGDLSDFASSHGVADAWDAGPDAALQYLAARTRRGRRDDPGLAPTSLRRRAAALKGFYRFAFGEGIIATDVAAHLDLPRMTRLLPETLTQDETERLLGAPAEDALL